MFTFHFVSSSATVMAGLSSPRANRRFTLLFVYFHPRRLTAGLKSV